MLQKRGLEVCCALMRALSFAIESQETRVCINVDTYLSGAVAVGEKFNNYLIIDFY